jgi:DNA helicase-2/ATP-dependent DNA helicase PcrA
MTELRTDLDHDAVCASRVRHQLVVAPPGTGKTTVSVRLAAELLPELDAHARVLLLTFSNQARTQLEREAARQLRPAARSRIEITNYHRFLLQGVAAYRRALGLAERLDLGSSKRRKEALEPVDPNAIRQLDREHTGLLDALGEHAFAPFRDERTPPAELLDPLLEIVHAEQRAGRLVFDDLGALFWQLLERFPVIERAYLARYPVVIADEHQDASALQDALVRRLGTVRLTVLADPMQLIHGFRGARVERLDRHRDECDEMLTLSTPHRWHGSDHLAEWLLGVRARLMGAESEVARPAELHVATTNAAHGMGPIKAQLRVAIHRSRDAGLRRIGVIVTSNQDAKDLRSYLTREGLRPRQIGGNDFEEARIDIEQLPLLADPQTLARHALQRLEALVPALAANVVTQIRNRLRENTINLTGAGDVAGCVLRSFECLYTNGAASYFEAVVGALDMLAERDYHLPRADAVRALRDTAHALAGQNADVDAAIAAYSQRVIAAAHLTAPRLGNGVFVMTAHQAKGKEFDTVILANPLERHYPGTDEGRRLFYVAITRATARWVIVVPDSNATPLLQTLGI